jgi:hypothetical protein
MANRKVVKYICVHLASYTGILNDLAELPLLADRLGVGSKKPLY